ncbi:MAG: sigma 54-interacting transcriptional regulator [Pseudomonadota bacterium]|nr:sigma 54-interacting transcriptional regulator [Pseudomonadota bacterium]
MPAYSAMPSVTDGMVELSDGMTGPALDKDRLLKSIFRISNLLTMQANQDEILAKILDELVDAVGFESGIIRLFDETQQCLITKAVKNYREEDAVRAFSTPLNIKEHDCLATKVARTGDTLTIRNAATDPRITPLDRMLTNIVSRGSIVCAPLRIGDYVIGTLAAWRREEVDFFAEEINLFLTFSNQVSVIIHNARLLETNAEKIRHLTILQEAVSEMNQSYALDNRILEIVFASALKIAQAERAMGYVWDLEKDRCLINDGERVVVKSKQECDRTMSASLVREAIEKNATVVNAAMDGGGTRPLFPDFPVEIAIPFHIRDKFVGALLLAKRKGGFTSDQVNVLDVLIKNAATAYDNAIMHSLLSLEAETLKTEVEKLKEREDHLMGFHDILGKSRKMIDIFHVIADVAGHDTNILIQGESGTGKELIARAIHRHSHRSLKPFVDINCAAIPATLLESELFGYEAGAFTDARKRKIGLLEYCFGGTMLLDEIGEMPTQLQAKFLRMLEDGHIRRLGGNENIPIDVRFVFSTNRDLGEMVAAGAFREDLFYRISVVPVMIPPLRERADDIVMLARYFVQEFNKKFTKRVKGFTREAEAILQAYSWPGNVRELKNIIERIMILKGVGNVISADNMPAEMNILANKDVNIKIAPFLRQLPLTGIHYDTVTEKILKDVKERILENALRKSGGNKTEAAKQLGISRYKFIREHKKYREEKRGASP